MNGTSAAEGLPLAERKRSSRVLRTPSSTIQRLGSTSSSIAPGPIETLIGSDDKNIDSRPLNTRKLPTNATNHIGEAMKTLTEEEREKWDGWVELESEPALFSYILRSYGVEGVKVQEVLSLDLLFELPKPVYGLIFLFKYRDDDAEEMEGVPTCPEHVWFANQTTDNACATVALLNIVMNVPSIELGDHLATFRQSTKTLKPAYRGQQLSGNKFVRNIHNSFVRRMDILNADLSLSNQYEKWLRAAKAKKRAGAIAMKTTATSRSKANLKPKSKPGLKRKKQHEEDEPGYHFIAYVPIGGSVWRLDGLQRQPINIGDTTDDWMNIARDNILHRAVQYEDDGIEYSLMSLCRSPLPDIREELIQNFKATVHIEKRLQETVPDWRAFAVLDEPGITESFYETFKLSQSLIDRTTLSDFMSMRVDAAADPACLLELRKSLGSEQTKLRMAYIKEVTNIEQENELAQTRKNDQTPLIYNTIKALADAGELKDIVLDIRDD